VAYISEFYSREKTRYGNVKIGNCIVCGDVALEEYAGDVYCDDCYDIELAIDEASENL
jgi:hypothetical protein|tara:strand:- start:433 stop:606 length:174 start_codon:yes stop_codon:yes gene_type:complete